MYPPWPIYVRHKTQQHPSGVNDLIFQINWVKLFADCASCGIRFQIFDARYLKDFKP